MIDAGLLAVPSPHLTVTMPTSSGKTHLAEWAILHALAERPGLNARRMTMPTTPSSCLSSSPRHLRRKRLFPFTKTDVAAELAVHYGRLGPVLIAAPKKASTATAARAVVQACRRAGIAFGADAAGAISPGIMARRERVAAAVAAVAGADHELAQMVRVGVGYHHADIHETIRLELEAAFREGAVHVLCATSTLGQGVNLPAKTVLFSGTWRGQDDELPIRDFWNIAGRGARPFLETEGHVILIAATDAEAKRLRRRYLDGRREPIYSTLTRLYVGLVRARLGRLPPA